MGAVVSSAELGGVPAPTLRLLFQSTGWHRGLLLPAPWFYTACLGSVASVDMLPGRAGWYPASDLIGLEGAVLSGVEPHGDWFDLVFHSIQITCRSPQLFCDPPSPR